MGTWHLASSSIEIGNIIVLSSVTMEVCTGCPGARRSADTAGWTQGEHSRGASSHPQPSGDWSPCMRSPLVPETHREGSRARLGVVRCQLTCSTFWEKAFLACGFSSREGWALSAGAF